MRSAFVVHRTASLEAEGEALAVTLGRDKAYQDLRNFMKELKGVARGVLCGNRAALSRLEL